MGHPYRSEAKIGTCPECGSPGVILLSYQIPDPSWVEEYAVDAPEMVTRWKCGLCMHAPQDPRKAMCYIGNLILNALKNGR